MDYEDINATLNEPINEHNSSGSLVNFSCSLETYGILNAVIYPIAIIIITILALLSKREQRSNSSCSCRCKTSLQQCNCIFPLNMLDGYEDRLGYACVFGTMTVQLIDLLTRRVTLSGALTFDQFLEPTQTMRPALQIMVLLLNVGFVTFAFYPLFACISTSYKFVGAILGIVCSSYRLAIGLWTVGICHKSSNSDFILDRYESVFYNVPSLVFLCILIGNFMWVLRKCILKQKFGLYTKKQKFAEDHHVLHVRRLLGKAPLPWHEEDLSHASILQSKKFKATFFYKPMPYFRFPTRLVATFTIMVAGLYQVGLMVIFQVWSLIKMCQRRTASIDAFSNAYGAIMTSLVSESLPEVNTYLGYANNTWMVVTCVTFSMAAIYLYHTAISYRRHIFKLYRGDRGIFPTSWLRRANQNIMTDAVRYAGLQIAYFMWGFVLIQVFVFILASLLVFAIFVPMIQFKYFDIVQYIAEIVMAPILMNMAIYYAQVILIRFLFLQPKTHSTDAGVPLAVNNRYVFYNVSLFFFFWNIFLGIVSAIMRVVKGMLLGIFLIPRIDRSVMMRGYESLDGGFMCYLGVLSVINAHDHPVVKVFLKVLKDGSSSRSGNKTGDDPRSNGSESKGFNKISRKARYNWFLAYSLIHNPDLIQYRRSNLKLVGIDETARHRVMVAVNRKREGGKTSQLFAYGTGDNPSTPLKGVTQE